MTMDAEFVRQDGGTMRDRAEDARGDDYCSPDVSRVSQNRKHVMPGKLE